MEGCLDAIANLGLPPSLIIVSGGGYQPIWLLDAPLPAEGENVAQVEGVARRVAALTGGDAVQNADRILRVPFTMNYPNETKRRVGRVPRPSGVLGRVVQ